MPETSEYENEADWMAACVPMRMEEGDEQEQAVAVCLSMWSKRNDKTTPMPEGFEYALGTNLTDWKQEYYTNKANAAAEDKTVDTTPIEPDDGNALKAISKTGDELRVGNYIVLFGGRDLEGIKLGSTEIEWTNPDGSRGEYFTQSTDLESPYTKSGRVLIDVEHGEAKQRYGKDAPGRDDVLGFVDWSTKRVDERGVWVERALDMHNWYMQWLSTLIDEGIVGTSSEAVEGNVQKSADGAITRWPLKRDSLTFTPMEWRNKGENVVQALKALGVPVPNDTTKETSETWRFTPDGMSKVEPEATPSPEPEASPEADAANEQRAAVDVAKARARLQLFKLSLEEQ